MIANTLHWRTIVNSWSNNTYLTNYLKHVRNNNINSRWCKSWSSGRLYFVINTEGRNR